MADKRKNPVNSRIFLYFIIFMVTVIVFSSTLLPLSFIYRPLVLFPISYSGYGVLKILGINLQYIEHTGHNVFEYLLPDYRLLVTFGCTGVFALFILLSGITAFPSKLKSKVLGAGLLIPVFYIFSILRLVIIGIIAYIKPDWVDFFHKYLMEIVNIIFVLSVFIIWVEYVSKTEKAS